MSNQEIVIDGETFQILGIAHSQREIDFVKQLETSLAARTTDVSNTSAAPIRDRVAASASSIQLAAARSNRAGITVHNDSAAGLYICEGATASAISYDLYIPPGGVWESDKPVYTGAINGIWTSATGAAQVTDRI